MSQIIFISDSSDDDEKESKTMTPQDRKKIEPEENAPPETAGNDIGSEKSINSDHYQESSEPTAQIKKVFPKRTTEEIFVEFCDLCKKLMEDNSDAEKILKYLQRKHKRASYVFKSSRKYRKLLQRYIYELKQGSTIAAVYINDVVSILGSNTPEKNDVTRTEFIREEDERKRRLNGNETGEDLIKKRRIQLNSVHIPTENEDSNFTNSLTINSHGSPKMNGGVVPSTSHTPSRPSEKNDDRAEKRIAAKIKFLENHLKRLSNEITKIQQREMTLEEMDQKDSSYMVECKLKSRCVKVYRELCTMKEIRVRTGRVIEQRIKVKSTRFMEINKKIEKYINNPKRSFIMQFPDFLDIRFLVKQANQKHNLGVPKSQINVIAQDVFQEVGEKMQKRRHTDFIYDFGCSFLDKEIDAPDPALEHVQLREKLSQNRTLASLNLDSVIEKYSRAATELGRSAESSRTSNAEAKEEVVDLDSSEEEKELMDQDNLEDIEEDGSRQEEVKSEVLLSKQYPDPLKNEREEEAGDIITIDEDPLDIT